MSNHIADGIEAVNNLSLNDAPNFSPFPKLNPLPPNVPPSDDDLEATLENARPLVLNSNDPEMQLAWAADALVYVGVCADNEERIAAAKPNNARSATPRIEHQLKVDSMNITTFLADQHHPKAEFLRGMWLEWGRFGQREDKKEAFRCYSRAADRGYARAEYRIGMLYESYNDAAKALRHYNRGVEAGDAASCYRLGMMTLRGQHGQQQDFPKALDLIRRSADGADENAAQGAYVYGMLLARQLPQIELPDGVLPYDEQAARRNIEKAAYLKFAKAQLKMGSCYELGSFGCEFSPALSMHYNALASKQGEAEADMALSKWFLVGSDGLFPKNEKLAYTYAERAAQLQLPTAEFALGYFNEIGMNVPVNLEKALEWYQKASKHGNSDAAGRIDGLSRKQVLSKKDHENVAISRIKSTYGSKIGGRPDRFKQQQPSSYVQDSNAAAYSNGGARPGAMQPPARGTTPYPEDDRPPIIPPADNRPASVAPYPLQDGPPKPPRLGPTGGFFNPPQQQPQRPPTTLNPENRPSSAFHVNPDLRPNSVGPGPVPSAAGPGPGLQPQYGPRPGYGGGPAPGARPATAQPYNAQGGRPPVGNRVASGPSSLSQLPSQQSAPNLGQAYPSHQGTPGPMQNYPPQQGAPAPLQPRPPIPHQATSPAAPQQAPQSKLDIGFSAPPDDRRTRTYGPGRPPADPSQRPDLKPTNTMPNFDQPAPGRQGTPASSRPGSSRPPDATVKKPEAPTSRPPPRDSNPAPKPVTHTSTAPPATAKPPPGKGPKTFDEMGVPAQKQDSECVSRIGKLYAGPRIH